MRKKIGLIMIGCSLLAGMLLAGQYAWKGAGTTATLTTTPQLITVPSTNYCFAVDVYNSGSETAWVQIATTTNSFVATNAIPIPAGFTYRLGDRSGNDEDHMRRISSIVGATTSSTTSIFCAFQ